MRVGSHVSAAVSPNATEMIAFYDLMNRNTQVRELSDDSLCVFTPNLECLQLTVFVSVPVSVYVSLLVPASGARVLFARKAMELGEYVDVFRTNKIDGELLAELQERDLIEVSLSVCLRLRLCVSREHTHTPVRARIELRITSESWM